MRIAVLGYGSIARRYLDLLRETDFAELFAEPLDVALMRGGRSPLNGEHRWVRQVYDMSEILRFAPQVAIIASPATEHIRQGLALAEAGADLLIEKPLSVDLAGVDELIAACGRQGRVLMIGYNLAYLNALDDFIKGVHAGEYGRVLAVHASVGQYLPDWRPHIDYRRSVSAARALGGGVIAELSHEIEYVDRLIGGTAEIVCCSGQSGLLEMDAEDRADLMMKGADGVVAHVHMDMLMKQPVRACHVLGLEGSGSMDLLAAAKTGNNTYRDQLRDFFACRRGLSTPRVPGVRGRRVTELLLAAKESAEKGIRVQV